MEEIHHHPASLQCDCCQNELVEIGATIAREEAKFIPAKMMRVKHIEHAYECKQCKKDPQQNAFIQRGKAPTAVIPRSLAGPTVLAKILYDKFALYLPLYRQVKEWTGLVTNDKNLSNWMIRVAEEWLLPIYKQMKNVLSSKSLLHIDETSAQVLNRSDGRPAQSNAYNRGFRTVVYQGPVIILFEHALTRGRIVLKDFLPDFKGTIICDGYSAYENIPNVTFANCWAHVRRYRLKADSKNGRIGAEYCHRLYRLERQFKHLSPSKRRKARQKYSKPIVEEFFNWVDQSHTHQANNVNCLI